MYYEGSAEEEGASHGEPAPRSLEEHPMRRGLGSTSASSLAWFLPSLEPELRRLALVRPLHHAENCRCAMALPAPAVPGECVRR
jgi:hypothetical protein